MGWFTRTFGGGPGNAARDRRRQEDERRAADEAQTTDPYGSNPRQFDENGFLIGPMPKGQYSLDYQYEANRRAEQRRQTLWGDAQNAIRQGQDLYQSYRPGGAAAAASGLYGQSASLYGTQALNTEAPDLLIDFREQARQQANEERRKNNRNSQLITGFSSFNVVGGGTPTTINPPPDEPGGADAPDGGGASGGQVNLDTTPDGTAELRQSGPGANSSGDGGLGGLAPGGGSDQQGGTGGGSASNVRLAGSGQDQGPTVDGSYGGGSGGYGVNGGPRGQGGSNVRDAGSGGGYRGEGMPENGADAPMTQFNGQETASRSMGNAQGSVGTTTEMWADDPGREQSTALIVSGARRRLLEAMA